MNMFLEGKTWGLQSCLEASEMRILLKHVKVQFDELQIRF